MGITADNSANLEAAKLQYGDGSLLTEDGRVNFQTARYYQKLYGECWIDLCERSLQRMKKGPEMEGSRGCLIGISSPGCNLLQSVNAGYSMPGTGNYIKRTEQEFGNLMQCHQSQLIIILSVSFDCREVMDGIFDAYSGVQRGETGCYVQCRHSRGCRYGSLGKDR